jgi:hypothetical protein
MLSSAVDLQGELSQALEEGRVDSLRKREQWSGKNRGVRSSGKLQYSHCREFSNVMADLSIGPAFEAPWKTTY